MSSKPKARAVADQPAFRLFLRVRHPSIDPAELTREFGTEPLHCFRAGEARTSSGRRAVSGCHADSYWLAEVEPVSPLATWSSTGMRPGGMPAIRDARERVEQMAGSNAGMAVTVLAMRLLQPRALLLKRLRAEEGEVTLMVQLDRQQAEPFTVAPQMLRLLADLGVTVAIEFADQ